MSRTAASCRVHVSRGNAHRRREISPVLHDPFSSLAGTRRDAGAARPQTSRSRPTTETRHIALERASAPATRSARCAPRLTSESESLARPPMSESLPHNASRMKRALIEAGFEVFRTRDEEIVLAERPRENLIMDSGVRLRLARRRSRCGSSSGPRRPTFPNEEEARLFERVAHAGGPRPGRRVRRGRRPSSPGWPIRATPDVRSIPSTRSPTRRPASALADAAGRAQVRAAPSRSAPVDRERSRRAATAAVDGRKLA